MLYSCTHMATVGFKGLNSRPRRSSPVTNCKYLYFSQTVNLRRTFIRCFWTICLEQSARNFEILNATLKPFFLTTTLQHIRNLPMRYMN